MAKGILGKKLGMTQVFDENGSLVPVTVIDATANVVMQQKTVENDGYAATQVGFDDKRESLSNKPEQGHAAKASTTPKRFVKELRFKDAEGNEFAGYSVGQEIKCDIFAKGDVVDVTGTSKGKGTAGVIKRWNAHRGPMAHGSGYHRGIGSMGPIKCNMKGKHMSGRLGAEQVTIQNLVIVDVDVEKEVILIKGNVPGPKNSYVVIKTAVKG